MKANDFEEFKELWVAAWQQRGKTPTGGALQLAFQCLSKYDIDTVSDAIIDYCGSEQGQWLISPSAVIQIIDRGPSDLWAEFIEKLGSVGPYRDPVFSDPVINAGVRALGGWVRCCSMSYEELEAQRNQFSAGVADADQHSARPVLGYESQQKELANPVNNRISDLTKQRRLGND